MATWIVRNSDGAWMVRGFGDPALIHTQPTNYTAVEVPGELCPDPRLERYDSSLPSKRRAATLAEISFYDEAIKEAIAIKIDTDPLIQAVAQLDYEERQKLQVKNGQRLFTPSECKARIRAIYRSLLVVGSE